MKIRGFLWLLAIGAAFVSSAGPRSSQAAVPDASDWSKAMSSAMRLVTAGGMNGDAYRAAVEIKLDPGSLTYWRQPGDAGVPPVFSFDGSTNLGHVEVLYPAPRRFEEAGAAVFGYRDNVMFPLAVSPKDPARPVDLAVHLQYAACNQICVPATGDARLTLAPKAPRGAQADRIDTFDAQVPRPMGSAGASAIALTREAGDKPVWKVTVRPGVTKGADLFAEAPEGWYFDTRPAAEGFDLVLAQKPSDALNGPVPIVLTLVDGAKATEAHLSLDAANATP